MPSHIEIIHSKTFFF